MKLIQGQNIKAVTLLLLGSAFISCRNSKPPEQTNNLPKEQILAVSPTTATDIPVNNSNLKVNEVTDKEFHEYGYEKNLKIISVFQKLTKIESKYLGKIISDKEQEIRKNRVFEIINSLGDNDKDLIKLAKMCRIFRGTGGQDNEMFAAPIYDIAFFYSVKIVAAKYKDNENVMNELRELKKFNLDGALYGDFLLALEGKDPVSLYGKDPLIQPSQQ